MSAAARLTNDRSPRRLPVLWLLWVALPLLGLGVQIASKLAAEALLGEVLSWRLVARGFRLPAAWAAVSCELAGLGAWMVILSEIPLGAAFSVSALSYVLVVATSWTLFHEPIGALQIVGGAAILTGVWLIGRAPREE